VWLAYADVSRWRHYPTDDEKRTFVPSIPYEKFVATQR
jgi:hypothetical protein